MNRNSVNPWKISPETFGEDTVVPTWVKSTTGRSYNAVLELGAALGENYPHFLAVLRPETAFLHYLISRMICNVVLFSKGDPDKRDLEPHVDRLYKEYLKSALKHYKDKKQEIADNVNGRRANAESYYAFRQSHTTEAVATTADEAAAKQAEFELFKNTHGINITRKYQSDTPANQALAQQREFETLKTKYDLIDKRIREGKYTPGEKDKAGLNTFEKVFVAACSDAMEQKEINAIAYQTAGSTIKTEIKAGRLTQLPFHPTRETQNIVIAGNITAGKTHLFENLQRTRGKHRVDRTKCAVIDIDEFRDLDHIVGYERLCLDNGPIAKWADWAHDECQMIRRKIFDELDRKAQKAGGIGESPNVVLMTSHLSPRARRWLMTGETKAYFLYRNPVQSVNRAASRSQKTGHWQCDHWVDTPTILGSFKNLAESLFYAIKEELGPDSRLTIEVQDTSQRRLSDMGADANAQTIMGGTAIGLDIQEERKTVLKADKNGIQMYDPETFWLILKGKYINKNLDAPRPAQLYNDHDQRAFYNSVVALIKPHTVDFYAPNNPHQKIGTKPPGFETAKSPPQTTAQMREVARRLGTLYQNEQANLANERHL